MIFNDYTDLIKLAEAEGFHVTSTNGGAHNRGSKHFAGLAIDVRTRDKTAFACDEFIKKCRALGLTVYDERRKPPKQKVWSGAHIHIEINKTAVISQSVSLQIGSKGIAVKDLQNKLVKAGFLHDGEVDGIFGKRTLHAVMLFQRKNGLTADGKAGKLTVKELAKV